MVHVRVSERYKLTEAVLGDDSGREVSKKRGKTDDGLADQQCAQSTAGDNKVTLGLWINYLGQN